MAKKHSGKRGRRAPKTVLRLPDLDQAKSAVLNSLSSTDAQRGYRHAMEEFIEWYRSEPRLSFSKSVVLRYRIHLESRHLAPGTINLRLGAVRRQLQVAGLYEICSDSIHLCCVNFPARQSCGRASDILVADLAHLGIHLPARMRQHVLGRTQQTSFVRSQRQRLWIVRHAGGCARHPRTTAILGSHIRGVWCRRTRSGWISSLCRKTKV